MDDMSAKKPTAREELERIEDALAESILQAAGRTVREEITAAGGDPDALIARIDAAIASARGKAARARLEGARGELAAWRAKGGSASAVEREAARARLQRLRSGDAANEGMMMAARKGEGLSEKDAEGLVEDLAELERLERSDSNE
jgi:hypothetical protein